MAHILVIEESEAQGALRDVYAAMKSRPLPPVYRAPHGGPPGIVRAHSVDARMIQVTFGATTTMHQGDEIPWPQRELMAAIASRTNQCDY